MATTSQPSYCTLSGQSYSKGWFTFCKACFSRTISFWCFKHTNTFLHTNVRLSFVMAKYPFFKKMKKLSMKVWLFINFLINLLNSILFSSIHFKAVVLQLGFLDVLCYLPREGKMGGIFISLKRLRHYFVNFPLGAFWKQLSQFCVKTQWSQCTRWPDFLNQQLGYLWFSLTSGPIPSGNRMNVRYQKIKTVWTSSCLTCSS